MSKIVLDDVISGYGLSKINENFQKIQDELNDKVLYRDNPDGEANTLEQDVDVNGFSLYNVEKINNVTVDTLTENVDVVVANMADINAVGDIIADVSAVADIDGDVSVVAGIAEDISALVPYASDIPELVDGIYENLADTDGASLIGYGSQTVEDVLDSLSSVEIVFEYDTTGATDSTDEFVAFVNEVASTGKIGRCKAGICLLDKEHVQFNNLSNIKIICDEGFIVLDNGRNITGVGGTRRIPWGVEFVECTNIEIIGGTFSTPASGMSGSSTNIFDSTNYTQRKPVLGFVDCSVVKLDGVKQKGDPGVGIATVDRDAIITALSLTPTPAEYGYFGLRNAFFNFYGCNVVTVVDNEIVPDTGARERFTFLDCDNVSVVRPTSVSTGNNFASLGKVIQCSNVVIDDCKVTDTGTGSLWDFIGQNITFKNTHIDYPNGKLCDISHEWGPANAPSDNILIADCTTNGMGVTNVTGASTTSQVVDNPITNVRIRNVRTNKGKSSWSTNVDWVRLPSVINYVVEGAYVENGSIGYTHTNNGGQRIELRDLTMRWTVASASLSTNARTFHVPVEMNFYGCDIDADATGVGVSSLSISGGAGVPCRFVGCKINDTVFETSNPAVEFIGCVINSSSITASGSGSISYKNCVVDGVLTNSGANGAVVKLHRLDATITAGEEYGGWEFIGNDSSTDSSGIRASLKVVAEGTGGDVYLSYSTAPFTSTTLTERLRVYSNGSIAVFNMPTSAPATSKTLWSDGGIIKITA